jgi:hypothetical protein
MQQPSPLKSPLSSYQENTIHTAGSAEGLSMSVTTMIFIAVFTIIVILCGYLLWLYWPKRKDTAVLGPFVLTMIPATDEDNIVPVFSQEQIEKYLGNNFSLGFFVYMDKINESRIPFAGSEGDYRFKPFINIVGVGSFHIDPIHEEARFNIHTSSPEFGKKADLIVKSFLIARWNQVVLTVEGRTLDVYVNGILKKSMLLENVPAWKPIAVLLETSPDFAGQAGLFQAWPFRLTESAILKNYKDNTDKRGKPSIPDIASDDKDIWAQIVRNLCKIGFCIQTKKKGKKSKNPALNPTEYVDYEYA